MEMEAIVALPAGPRVKCFICALFSGVHRRQRDVQEESPGGKYIIGCLQVHRGELFIVTLRVETHGNVCMPYVEGL